MEKSKFFEKFKRNGKRPFGKVFSDQVCSVILSQLIRKQLVENLLVAEGAEVRQYTARTLKNEIPLRVNQLNYIFSDPDTFMTDTDFNIFMSRNKHNNWNIKVLSYFYVFRKITNPEVDSHVYFRLENPALRHLHLNKIQPAQTKRAKVDPPPPIVDLDSSEEEEEKEDEEDEVQFIAVKKKRIRRIECIDIDSEEEICIVEERAGVKPEPEHITIDDSGSEDDDLYAPGEVEVATDDEGEVMLVEVEQEVVVVAAAAAAAAPKKKEVIPSLEDRKMIVECIKKFSNQLSQSSSCIDTGDMRSKTIRYAAKGDKSEKRVQKAQSFDSTTTYTMVELYNNEENGGNDTDYLMAVDMVKTATSHISYPPKMALKKIFQRCILNFNGEEALVHAAHELFNHVLHLHPPCHRVSRAYYLEVFQNRPREIVLEQLQRVQYLSSRVALEIILSTIQMDLEYYWKHPNACKDEGLLVLGLCHNGSAHKIDQDIKTFIDLSGDNDSVQSKFVRRITTLLSLYASMRDKKSNSGYINATGGQKYKIALTLCKDFYARHESPERLMAKLSLIRPSWLALSVAAHLEKSLEDVIFPQDENGIKISQVLALETHSQRQKLLKLFIIRKLFGIYFYHNIHWILCLTQKLLENDVPPRFEHLKSDEKVEGDANEQVFTLDNKITFSVEGLVENMKALGEIIQSQEEVVDLQALFLKMQCLTLC